MVFEYGLIAISFATFMFVIIGVMKSCKHAKHGLKAQQTTALSLQLKAAKRS